MVPVTVLKFPVILVSSLFLPNSLFVLCSMISHKKHAAHCYVSLTINLFFNNHHPPPHMHHVYWSPDHYNSSFLLSRAYFLQQQSCSFSITHCIIFFHQHFTPFSFSPTHQGFWFFSEFWFLFHQHITFSVIFYIFFFTNTLHHILFK